MTKNAAITDILESLGAIPYVKTNVPQALMVCSEARPLYYLLRSCSGQKLTTSFLEGRSTLSIVHSLVVVLLVAKVPLLVCTMLFSSAFPYNGLSLTALRGSPLGT